MSVQKKWQEEASHAEKPNARGQSWLLLVTALFLVSINLRPAITSIAPILEQIREDLMMSRLQVSLLTSIPVLCMGVFAPLAASLSARWGIGRVVSGCLVLIGVTTLFRAWAQTSALLLLTAFLIGIGIAVAGPLLSGFIKQNFPHKSALMIGVYSVGIGLGASISAGMSIPLQQLFFGSWKWSLAAWSGLALIALFFWHYAMKRTAAVNDVAPAEKEARLPWTNKRAWVLLAFFGLQSALFYSTAAWFAPIVQEAGMSRFESGTLVLFFALVQMLFGLVIPLLMNVYPARRPWMVGCCLAVLLGLVWLGLFPGQWVWAQAFVVGIGLGGLFPIGLMLPLDETSSPQEAGAWTAMMQTGGYLISCLAPVLTGYLRDVTGGYGYSFVFWIVLSVALLAIALGYGNKQGR